MKLKAAGVVLFVSLSVSALMARSPEGNAIEQPAREPVCQLPQPAPMHWLRPLDGLSGRLPR